MNTQEIEIQKVIDAPADEDVRVLLRWFPGDAPIQQGDVYLHPVPKDWARGKLRKSAQVADGTSVGSRHVVLGEGVEVYEGVRLPPGCTLPEGARLEDILGPVIVGTGTALLAHPKHAHHSFPLENCAAQVTYPFDYTTRRREQD